MGLPYMPITWGGARGVNVAAYMAVPCSVWDMSCKFYRLVDDYISIYNRYTFNQS